MTDSAASATIAAGRAGLASVGQFIRSRGLSRPTLEALGVGSATVFFPSLKRDADALVFPYGEHWKARAVETKDHVTDKGFALEFWNLRNVLAAPSDCAFIVEGELDACALVEAGLAAGEVLSVPNGAREKPATDAQRGYQYVKDALTAGLARKKKFVWCGDEDGPGYALRSDMVNVLGAARFHFVAWPKGCKDANDVLRQHGAQKLNELVTWGAQPWPVDGLYRFSELPEPAPMVVWQLGFTEWGERVMVAPQTLSVATGYPNHGKTALWAQLWFNVTRDYDVPVFIASFETRYKPHLQRMLRSLHSGKRVNQMSEDELIEADKFIDDHYVVARHKHQRASLEWILDRAEIAVVRHGCRIVQIDPWNRMEAARRREETETDYIGRCLEHLYIFANDMGCHLQIIAHPKGGIDVGRRSKDGERPRPELTHISGSQHWDNKVDQGFVVHRPHFYNSLRSTETDFWHIKSRFNEELGFTPTRFALDFDMTARRYFSTDKGVPA